MFLIMSTIGKIYCIGEGKERVLSWDESHPSHESFGAIHCVPLQILCICNYYVLEGFFFFSIFKT